MAESVKIVRLAWRGLFETWRQLAPLVLMTIVVMAIVNWVTDASPAFPSFAPGATPQPGVEALRHDLSHLLTELRILGVSIVQVCVEMPLEIAICRLLILGDRDWRRPFRRPSPYLRLLGYDLLLGAIFLGLVVVFGALGAISGVLLSPTVSAASGAAIILTAIGLGVVLGLVVGWYLWARLSLVLPAIAVGERNATLRAAWRRSPGWVGAITRGFSSAIPLFVLVTIVSIAQRHGAPGRHPGAAPALTSGLHLLGLLGTSGLGICCQILYFSIVACVYRAGSGPPWSGSVRGGLLEGPQLS